MKKCILVITDKIECNWIDTAVRSNRDDYDLLILGLNADGLLYINRDKFDRINSLNTVDVGKFAEHAQEKIRKFIPDFIYEFPKKKVGNGKSIKEIFHFKNINFWWFNKMAEKGALGTPFIKTMYYLELIRNVVLAKEYNEIWLEIKDDSILKLLKNNQNILPRLIIIGKPGKEPVNGKKFYLKLFYNIFLYQGFYLCRFLLLKGFRSRIKIKDHSILFFTFYPYFWNKSSKNSMTELFFQSLPARLNEQHPICYITWLSLGLRDLWSKRSKLINDFKYENIVPIETYLSLKDFLDTFFISAYYILMVLKFRRRIMNTIREQYEGYNITNIILNEFNQCLATHEIITCVLMMKACSNTIGQNKINALIYRVEFQPYERAIIYGAKNNCTTIAFQHQALARNHLQYFFPKEEISSYYKNKNDPDNLPLADYYMVAGEYPFGVLLNSGFPREVLNICGPVRYANLVEYLKKKDDKNYIRKKYGYSEKDKIFLIASPVTKEEVFSLMLSLCQVMNEYEENILFLLKSHPVVKFDEEIVKIIDITSPDMKYRILPDDINLNDYLSLSDALILTGTTMGIEAICLGVVPILFENDSSFSLNPLLEIRDSCFCVRNAQELKQAIISVINDREEVEKIRRNWPNAIKKLFYDTNEDPNMRFIKILNNKGLIYGTQNSLHHSNKKPP